MDTPEEAEEEELLDVGMKDHSHKFQWDVEKGWRPFEVVSNLIAKNNLIYE